MHEPLDIALKACNIETIRILLNNPKINSNTIKLLLDNDKFPLQNSSLVYAIHMYKPSAIELLIKSSKQNVKEIFYSLTSLLLSDKPSKKSIEITRIILISMKERNDVNIDVISMLLKLLEDEQYIRLKFHVDSIYINSS